MEGVGLVIGSDDFCAALADFGVELVTGVPCSYFSAPIARFTREGRYVPAANEGAALAIAAGAAVAGTRVAVVAQNSGLGNLINPLTSLLMTYDVPALVFTSLRGWPDPGGDEPQHAVMGAATHELLDAIGVAHWTLRRGTDAAGLRALLAETGKELAAGHCVFVLVEKGAVEVPEGPAADPTAGRGTLTRAEALRTITARAEGIAVVATTGYTSRELFAGGDAPTNFYMQGSMGHASAFALGLALRPPGTEVVLLDGDGAALMHLGTMSTIGATAPPGLIHVVLDNGAYESTGAQATTSGSTDFAAIARATGYASAVVCSDAVRLDAAMGAARAAPGPHLLVVPIASMTGPAPRRATASIGARDIHHRLTTALGAGPPWADHADRR
ncbi:MULTISPECIES: phosphonopyruvate decarboxylase [unclassified Embleya]|uniref:phosphonopyruvate decarboxylase n=1 Tax=unclassified Embleya TaxID=2699296 RepID=UPI0036BD062D